MFPYATVETVYRTIYYFALCVSHVVRDTAMTLFTPTFSARVGLRYSGSHKHMYEVVFMCNLKLRAQEMMPRKARFTPRRFCTARGVFCHERKSDIYKNIWPQAVFFANSTQAPSLCVYKRRISLFVLLQNAPVFFYFQVLKFFTLDFLPSYLNNLTPGTKVLDWN